MVLSGNIKNKLLDVLESKINIISSITKLTVPELGRILRWLHFIMPTSSFFSVLFVNKNIVMLYIISEIIIISMFVFFNCCWLSSLEYRLTKQNFTMVDPYLKLINKEVNNGNRKKYTTIGLIIILIWFLFVYFYL